MHYYAYINNPGDPGELQPLYLSYTFPQSLVCYVCDEAEGVINRLERVQNQ